MEATPFATHVVSAGAVFAQPANTVYAMEDWVRRLRLDESWINKLLQLQPGQLISLGTISGNMPSGCSASASARIERTPEGYRFAGVLHLNVPGNQEPPTAPQGDFQVLDRENLSFDADSTAAEEAFAMIAGKLATMVSYEPQFNVTLVKDRGRVFNLQ